MRSISWTKLLFSILLTAFVAGGLYGGYLFYSTMKDLVAHAQLSSLSRLPAVSIKKSEIGTSGELLPQKKERVNILLLGTDEREGEHGPWRTDTMIVATIDPANMTAGILSIPRDLWVFIPGYSEGRINTAHFIGEAKDYPGGGPALAMKTVQYNLGISLHYYARINFDGFKKIIDTIGGIDIYVEEEIKDPKFPDERHGYEPLHITAGQHHFDGEMALKYARTRHGGSDFKRIERQQKVILAVRDKVLRFDLLPQFLPQLPQLMRTASESVQTDLPPEEIVRLARIAAQIDTEHIKTAAIDASLTMPTTLENGAKVLIPVREKIRPVVDDIFTSPPQVDEEQIEHAERLATEGAKIAVRNGTPTSGLAERTAAFLKKQGFQITEFGNADHLNHTQTMIIDYTGKMYTTDCLAHLFRVSDENVQHRSNPQGGIDICIILGSDWSLPEK